MGSFREMGKTAMEPNLKTIENPLTWQNALHRCQNGEQHTLRVLLQMKLVVGPGCLFIVFLEGLDGYAVLQEACKCLLFPIWNARTLAGLEQASDRLLLALTNSRRRMVQYPRVKARTRCDLI